MMVGRVFVLVSGRSDSPIDLEDAVARREIMGGNNRRTGFTLIELMVVVAILGILATMGAPAFTTYLRRSKTAEVQTNIDSLFKALAIYYNRPIADGPTINATYTTHCTINGTSSIPGNPTPTKQAQTVTNGYGEAQGIAFIVGYSYFKYSHEYDGTQACGNQVGSDAQVYTLHGEGDLDGDGTFSDFTLTVGTGPTNELYRASHLFIQDELE